MIDQETLKWLIGVSATDVNFKRNLKGANEATIRFALEQIKGKPNQTSRELALSRQLKNLVGDALEATKAVNARQEMGLELEMAPLVAEQEERRVATAEQQSREQMIAQSHEVAGQIKAAMMFSKFGDVSRLMWLKQVKGLKIYKDLPNIGTWEKYCDYLGLDRHTVDQDLLNLATFGEEFSRIVTSLQVGYREMRQLRQLTHDGTVTIEGDCLVIDAESIPIDQDHADDLQAAIERIITAKNEITARVDKLEKDFKGAVKEETQGLQLEKKALLKEVQRLKPFDPEEKDRTFALEQAQAISDKITELSTLCFKFLVDERVMEDPVLLGQVEGCFNSAELMLKDTRKRWEEVVNIFED